MFGALDITTSGMVAQRVRMDIISANVANARTLLNENGEYDPYRRRFAILAPGDGAGGGGVHVETIEEDQAPFQRRYEPGSRFADADGYVNYPNVNSILETMNAMEVARAYEANLAAAEATKSMMSVALQLIG